MANSGIGSGYTYLGGSHGAASRGFEKEPKKLLLESEEVTKRAHKLIEPRRSGGGEGEENLDREIAAEEVTSGVEGAEMEREANGLIGCGLGVRTWFAMGSIGYVAGKGSQQFRSGSKTAPNSYTASGFDPDPN